MNDNEPGRSSRSPAARRARLVLLATNLEHGPDGRPLIGEILREIEALHPGAIEREASRLQRRRAAPRSGGLDLALLDDPRS
ncbi:hypothetical protein [Brevundimonas bacteroides]|uniref:hypothetical protein n=1 Tax=Brevundimonas bacteroides TaxID=74311 RepID=UPI0004951FDA|nr:hypothetical protein [Brevundimonas bacteroides]